MSSKISRRSFLASLLMAGSVGALSSCSGGSPSSGRAPRLVGLYDSSYTIVSGVAQRIPFAAVEEADTILIPDDAVVPVSLSFEGNIIAEYTVKGHVVEHDHVGVEKFEDHPHSNLFRYFPLRATLPKPGIYDLKVLFYDVEASLAVQAFDASQVKGILPGEKFPLLDTPTISADGVTIQSRGVDRICTRDRECGLHQFSVSDLLASKKAFAVLVATPAFCSTSYCGPVLETLLKVKEDYPSLEMVHVEVYANGDAVGGNYADPAIEFAPFVKGVGLTFEPALFIVDDAGILIDRIDNIFDEAELRSILDTIG